MLLILSIMTNMLPVSQILPMAITVDYTILKNILMGTFVMIFVCIPCTGQKQLPAEIQQCLIHFNSNGMYACLCDILCS